MSDRDLGPSTNPCTAWHVAAFVHTGGILRIIVKGRAVHGPLLLFKTGPGLVFSVLENPRPPVISDPKQMGRTSKMGHPEP